MPFSDNYELAQYKLWLASENSDIDLYLIDVTWAPQLADQFLDLAETSSQVAGEHLPSVIASQTVDGRLVALPFSTYVPALYYRRDLLDKYAMAVPQTWEELMSVSLKIMEGEGDPALWGYVWQGAPYEGLTANALEWFQSSGGGQIVETDGTVSVNNENSVKALERARDWIGTISPPAVVAYREEEARAQWEAGNAIFMRNWPYAYERGNELTSRIKGVFGVSPLPSAGGDTNSAATLGARTVAVSRYSFNPDAAISLAQYLASAEFQKQNAILAGELPTILSLYDDPELAEKQPLVPLWREIVTTAVPRPAAQTKVAYNQVSSMTWSAVHETLVGQAAAEVSLERLNHDLDSLRGGGW